MSVRAKGYHPWTGQLNTQRLVWLPLVRQGLLELWRGKKNKLLFLMAAIPFLIHGVLLFGAAYPGAFIKQVLPEFARAPEGIFQHYLQNEFLFLMVLLVVLKAGAHTIANDLRHRAYVLYLSRPLRPLDYALGKGCSVFAAGWAMMGLPAFLLLILNLLFTRELASWRIWAALMVGPTLLAATLTVLVLFFSAYLKTARMAWIFTFMVYLTTGALGNILAEILRSPVWRQLSLQGAHQAFIAWLFGAQEGGPLGALFLLGLGVICTLLLGRRIFRLEA